MLIIGAVVYGIGFAMFGFVGTNMACIITACVLKGIGNAGISSCMFAIVSDTIEYGEWKTGKRITGISFSGNLFFLKVGLAVAGAMVGFLLSWYGYDAGAKAQSASALNGIVLLFSVIPGVGYLITAGVVRLLKVDRTLMRQIQSDLEKRRSNYSELNEYQELKTSEHVRKA